MQISHEEIAAPPSEGLYVPAGQSRQVSDVVDPVEELYFPLTHKTQTEAPVNENEPSGQDVQFSVPVEGAYIPATQSKHWLDDVWDEAVAALSAKYLPTAQLVQSSRESWRDAEVPVSPL